MPPPTPTPCHGARMRRAAGALLTALIALVVASSARAGQVRIDANSSNLFADSSAAINPGDQVVWVSTGGIHTVTSGTVDGGGTGTPDGRFDSGSIQSSKNGCFSWKSSGSGSVAYYCAPHAQFGMVGRLRILGTSVPVSDFRISEVRWTTAHDHDFIEIANLGDATGNLGLYRLSVSGKSPLTVGVQTGQTTLRDILVPSGSRVTVYLNTTGTNTATTIYWPGVALDPAGSAALYCPTTVTTDTTLTSTTLMVDYVQWGAGGYRNEGAAGTAGLWSTGNVVAAVADGHSIEFCGTRADRGPSFWQGSPTPTPGSVNCVTPVINSSWGRIKTLYR
jgi:plastocyanin